MAELSQGLNIDSSSPNYGSTCKVIQPSTDDNNLELTHRYNNDEVLGHLKRSISLHRSVIMSKKEIINRTSSDQISHQQSRRLEWFYKNVLDSCLPEEKVTDDQIFCLVKLIATNYLPKFFDLFNTSKTGFLIMEELMNGFRKLLKDSPCGNNEDVAISNLILNYLESSNTMNQQKFKALILDNNFLKIFSYLFKSGECISREEFCLALERLACVTEEEKYLTFLIESIKKTVGNDENISKENFKKLLRSEKQDHLLDKIFDVYGSNSTINVGNLISFLSQFILGTDQRKADILFQLFDCDKDGVLSHEDIIKTLEGSIKDCKVTLSEVTTKDLVYHFIKAIHYPRREKRIVSGVEFSRYKSADAGRPYTAGMKTDISLQLDASMNMSSNTVTDSLGQLRPIDKSQFISALVAHPDLLRNLTLAGNHLNNVTNSETNYVIKKRQNLGSYLCTRLPMVIFMFFLFLLNVALAVERGYEYRKKNKFLMGARICGQLLNLNSAIIFLFVCRHMITWLRASPLIHLLPLDNHIELHKWIGIWIFILSCVHGACHCGYAIDSIAPEYNLTIAEVLFTTKFASLAFEFLPGAAYITGWSLIIILTAMIIASSSAIRQKGFFEIFFGVHQLFFAFALLCLLHGPRFYQWFIAVGVIYGIERILRLDIVKKHRYGARSMTLLSAELLPSNVVTLKLQRPKNWSYSAGDYIFIKIKEIARFEYHPFTISSSPEIKDYITLHIQAVGNWTKRLLKVLQDAEMMNTRPSKNYRLRGISQHFASIRAKPSRLSKRLSNLGMTRHFSQASLLNPISENQVSVQFRASDSQDVMNVDKAIEPIEVFVEGPYGTPSRHIFEAEHAVLVCTGVGVTPFSSILQSIYHQYLQYQHNCPKCNHVYYQDPYETFSMKKVEFFWINRNHDCFEWFTDMLRDLEKAFEEDDKISQQPFLNMNFFHTGALQANVANKVALNLALDFVYQSHKIDLLSGLHRTRVTPGRPNWQVELQQISDNRRGKVSVFYCGNQNAARDLKQECDRQGFVFRQEVF